MYRPNLYGKFCLSKFFIFHLCLTAFFCCINIAAEDYKSKHSSTSDLVKINELNWKVKRGLCKDNVDTNESDKEGNSKPHKCDVESLDRDLIRDTAMEIIKSNSISFLCEDEEISFKTGMGFVLLQSGYPDVAVKHFTDVIQIQDDAVCPALHYGRAQAYKKIGLSVDTNAENVIKDYTTALFASNENNMLHIYTARAEAFTVLGQHAKAHKDLTEALKIRPTHSIYLLRGISLVYMEKYNLAYNDLKESLRLHPRQTLAMHYQAACLYQMKRLEDAIKTYEAILLIQPENTDIMQSIAHAHRELGNFDDALLYYDKALSINPTSPRLFQSKAELLYQHGDIPEALEAFRHCIAHEPYNTACQYKKGLCFASLGQFYKAVKEMTIAADRRPVKDNSGNQNYPTVMYVREWYRYVHSHLDTDMNTFNVDNDIHSGFKACWVRDVDFVLQNYTEQPGLQPHIKDVNPMSWKSQPKGFQQLLCQAYDLGKNMHLKGAVFGRNPPFGNKKVFTALGLASIEISQSVLEFWKAPKSYRSKSGNKFVWRDAFDIAVKWLRLTRMDKGTFWMDNQTELIKSYTYRLALIQNNQTVYGYENYFPKLYKMLLNHALFANKTNLRFDEKEDPKESYYALYEAEEREWDKEKYGDTPYVRANIDVKSKKDRDHKTLDGCGILLQLNSERNLYLTINTALTWPRSQQYHAELEFVWQKIVDEYKKMTSSSNNDVVSVRITPRFDKNRQLYGGFCFFSAKVFGFYRQPGLHAGLLFFQPLPAFAFHTAGFVCHRHRYSSCPRS
ncbi:unnamed protein product [Clavelina lepadiformis]|uniref:Tetratricopeptide repeat protein 13 n=1 Tax=Clavelina lepadiformis TaxID=159417 RepID=A0ABP0GPV7_CLALP